MRGKKGYFFIIDAVIASMVLFAGLFILFGGGVIEQETTQPLTTLEDIVTSIATVPMSSTLDEYYTGELLPNGLVPFSDATPLEEIAYLMYADCGLINCTSYAENYTLSLLENTLDPQYGAQISIEGVVLAEYGPAVKNYNFARSVIIYTRNETDTIGPLVGEVQLWG